MPGKRGRPAKCYTAPDGTEHHGFYRRTDGRWWIPATGHYLHRDTSPERVIEIYRDLMAGKIVPGLTMPGIPKPRRYSQTEVNAIVAEKVAAALADEQMVKLGSKEFWDAVRSEVMMTPWRVEKHTGITGLTECIDRWLDKYRAG